MKRRLGRALVHGDWQAAWWAGSAEWTALLGEPAHDAALDRTVGTLTPRESWHRAQTEASRRRGPIPADALVVLAGQQPVLLGGAGLVAHKAATAVALAATLEQRWSRPVVPVFLLATQDHDTGEVDHVDIYDPSNGSLIRSRCPIRPEHEMFSRARWSRTGLNREMSRWTPLDTPSNQEDPPLSEHVGEMVDLCFGPLGLRCIEAHRLAEQGRPILEQALTDPGPLSGTLGRGAAALRDLGRAPAFDPADPRPLVLESRDQRRRRIEAGDHEAPRRLAAHPDDFSPHAALRPIVQARSLPVVAQVAGPSEILYLGQARGLHELFGVPAPVLVPRLEATRLPDAIDPDSIDPADLDLATSPADEHRATAGLLEAVDRFRQELVREQRWMAPRVERFAERVSRGARNLVAAPTWRSRRTLGPGQRIHPRGRYQDTTLAWAPDAFASGDPQAWASWIVSLSEPQRPPEHVVYRLPPSLRSEAPDHG